MLKLHPLLERQLARSGIADASASPLAESWQRLLEKVSQTYTEADQERYLLERSLETSTNEMQTELTERKKVEAALQQAHEGLTRQNQQLARVNELFRVTMELMEVAIRRGANTEDLLKQLSVMQREFERLDQQNK